MDTPHNVVKLNVFTIFNRRLEQTANIHKNACLGVKALTLPNVIMISIAVFVLIC